MTRVLCLILLCAAAGCRTGPACPPGSAVADPDRARALRESATDRLPAAFTARFRGVLESPGGDLSFTALVRGGEGVERVLGLSDFGATLFELRSTGDDVEVLRDTSGLPSTMLREGLFRDLAIALCAEPPPGAALFQREGTWVLRDDAGRVPYAWVFDGEGSLAGIEEEDAGICTRHLRFRYEEGALAALWTEHFGLGYKARLVLLSLSGGS